MTFEQELEKEIRKELSNVRNQMKEDALEIMNEINDIYFEEANKIYDEYIRQYYLYETKSYVRHWEGHPGTKKGSNLYYGKNFKIHRGSDPYFELSISSDDMADDYQHEDAIDVLTDILSGRNIVRARDDSNVIVVWTRFIGSYGWTGKYKSRYFKYTGTLFGAIETFLEEYENNFIDLFDRRWKKKGW